MSLVKKDVSNPPVTVAPKIKKPAIVQINQAATAIDAVSSPEQHFSRMTLILFGFGLLMVVVLGSVVILWMRKPVPSLIEETASGFDIDELN